MSALADPASNLEAVTPSDTVNLTNATRGLWVGTGGNVAVLPVNGTAVTITNVASGTLLPIRILRVNSTNTTASNMVGLS